MQKYSFKRLQKILFLTVARMQMPGHLRTKIIQMGGVKIPDTTNVSIGEGCVIDRLYPENLTIGHHVRITMNCLILTHYFDTSCKGLRFKSGKVYIDDYVFLGAGTTICSPIVIGKHSVVGAGSVVTKNIPPYEIWAGNPARFIKVRPGYETEHEEWLQQNHCEG